MIKIKHIVPIIASAIVATLFFACQKKYDSPPVKTLTAGQGITIAQLKTMCTAGGGVKRFRGDTSLYATVTADETSGNIYKQVYLRDANGDAITMKLTSSGGLYVGDYIRVNLNYSMGSSIDVSNGSIQIDSVTTLNQVVKISVGNAVQPISVSLSQANTPAMDGQLVSLNDVEFSPADTGKPFADAVNHVAALGNHYLQDCGLTTAIQVYSSAYCNFASQKVPSKSGSMIAIVQRYNSSMELVIRNFYEVHLTNTSCGSNGLDSLSQVFSGLANNAVPALPGWINYNFVSGSYLWEGSTHSPASANSTALVASAPYSTACSCNNANSDAWLITPAINNSSTKYLSFENASGYNTNGYVQLFLYASTNFNGTAAGITSATWVPINTNQIGVNASWTTTGKIELNNPDAYNGSTNILNNYSGKFYIAFRFRSNMTDSTASYYLNNVIIKN